MTKTLLVLLAATCAGHAHATRAFEHAIPQQEKARIATVAKEARDARDITQQQYQDTMASLSANPCKGVDRALSNRQKAELAPIIAKEEGVQSVEVLQSYRLGNWRVIAIANHVSDDPFLFYSGDPRSTKPRGAWSGGATIFETTDVRKWAVANVPGIPLRLAGCFAWHVSLNRDSP